MRGNMRSKGDPLFFLLIVFPVGFLLGFLVAPVLYLLTYGDFWNTLGTTLIGFGIVGALVGGVFGSMDYVSARASGKPEPAATTLGGSIAVPQRGAAPI